MDSEDPNSRVLACGAKASTADSSLLLLAFLYSVELISTSMDSSMFNNHCTCETNYTVSIYYDVKENLASLEY